MSPARDAFERAYSAPLLDEDPAPPPLAAAPGGPPIAGVTPTLPFALRGTILTPDRRINDGYVEIAGSTIVRVGTARPAAGTPTIETDGLILPGLLDLHGHPEYNIFAAWEPPRLYANRTRWRDSDEYRLVVKEPLARLKADPSLERTLTRYAEARALVGGTTAIQGTNGKSATIDEALVRNVDRRIFGAHRARSIIDLDRTPPADRVRLRAQIDAGEVDAVYVHLAEGVDARSHDEFAELKQANLLTAATIIIHGTALTPADLDDVAAAGAKLVWSPQSNLRLYGATTPAGEAIRRGIPVALGADWQPSGSPSLLAELKIARQVLADQGAPATARQLLRMITTDAAGIAGLGVEPGSPRGRPAGRRPRPRPPPPGPLGERRRLAACRRRAGHDRRRPGLRPGGLDLGAGSRRGHRADHRLGQADARRHELQRPDPGQPAAAPRRAPGRAHRPVPAGRPDLRLSPGRTP